MSICLVVIIEKHVMNVINILFDELVLGLNKVPFFLFLYEISEI